MVYAANQSLPGDTLYPVKLRVEGIRLLVAAAPVENARLQMAYTQERFTEMVSLAEKQRAAEFPDAVQGYTHQLSATMTTLADEQVFTQEDRADLSRQLVDDLTDNELRLSALLVALPVKYPMPSDFRAAVETALALIQGSCEQARHWSGLPPLLPQSPAVPNPAQATTPTGQILTPSPTSTLVPMRASQTPRPITSTQDPDEMFTEWPTEWPPLEETPVPNPQWTEVNMPWPTQIDLPTAWPTELPPLPTVIQDYWPTEFSTFLPPEDLPDPGTPFPWPPDPDDPPGWPSE